MEFSWKGMTIFYHDIPLDTAVGTYFIDTPVGLVKVPCTYEEWENVSDVFQTWEHDARFEHDVYAM
eukprot:8391244-Pyramimonas_sp.AAC.1